MLNLQQISDAVHTTCYFGVIHAILSGQNFYKEYNKKFGRQVSRANDLMSAERRRWALVQKEKNGLYILDAELRHELKKEAVEPNIWVFPDKMSIYVNMVGDHQMDYNQRGPEANENRKSGDARTSFRGCPVFESQAFDVDFTGNSVDLLTRERQCGEWFLIPQGDVRYIYSCDSDKFEKITHAEAFKAAVNDSAAIITGGNKTSPNPNNLEGGVYQAKGIGATKDTAGTEAAWECKVDDSDVLIFRPNQTYRMASAILAKGGAETGSTFHGHHDFLLSDDIIRKVHRLQCDSEQLYLDYLNDHLVNKNILCA